MDHAREKFNALLWCWINRPPATNRRSLLPSPAISLLEKELLEKENMCRALRCLKVKWLKVPLNERISGDINLLTPKQLMTKLRNSLMKTFQSDPGTIIKMFRAFESLCNVDFGYLVGRDVMARLEKEFGSYPWDIVFVNYDVWPPARGGAALPSAYTAVPAESSPAQEPPVARESATQQSTKGAKRKASRARAKLREKEKNKQERRESDGHQTTLSTIPESPSKSHEARLEAKPTDIEPQLSDTDYQTAPESLSESPPQIYSETSCHTPKVQTKTPHPKSGTNYHPAPECQSEAQSEAPSQICAKSERVEQAPLEAQRKIPQTMNSEPPHDNGLGWKMARNKRAKGRRHTPLDVDPNTPSNISPCSPNEIDVGWPGLRIVNTVSTVTQSHPPIQSRPSKRENCTRTSPIMVEELVHQAYDYTLSLQKARATARALQTDEETNRDVKLELWAHALNGLLFQDKKTVPKDVVNVYRKLVESKVSISLVVFTSVYCYYKLPMLQEPTWLNDLLVVTSSSVVPFQYLPSKPPSLLTFEPGSVNVSEESMKLMIKVTCGAFRFSNFESKFSAVKNDAWALSYIVHQYYIMKVNNLPMPVISVYLLVLMSGQVRVCELKAKTESPGHVFTIHGDVIEETLFYHRCAFTQCLEKQRKLYKPKYWFRTIESISLEKAQISKEGARVISNSAEGLTKNSKKTKECAMRFKEYRIRNGRYFENLAFPVLDKYNG